jgi:hypothetical protein
MKLNYIWLALIIILFPGYAFGKCSEVGTIENDEYFWMESKRKADFCYKRYIHSGYLTVVTLKHKEGKGDYDVRVFSDSGFGNKISSSTATGAKSELLVLPIQEHSKYLYIYVNNYTDQYGKYEIYVHQIDLGELVGEALALSGVEYLAEAFIRELFGVDEQSSSSDQNDANRAAVGLVSQLQGKSLSDTTEGLLINEVRRAFAGDNSFVSAFMANFGTSLVKNIYSRY